MTQGGGSYLHSLDLLRGFAAMSVCLYHTGFLLTPNIHMLPGGYLCVDLFFLLSGFVIARTYDGRISAGMTLSSFCVQRLARLYPLFFVTTLIGFVATNARIYEEQHVFGGAPAFLTLFGNLLFIPNIVKPYGIDSLFPFNGATWSIFFEFYVNVLFFLFWRFITVRSLTIIIGLCAVWLVFSAAEAHSLDIGGKSADLVRAIPRVLFSFFLGVQIGRSALWQRQRGCLARSLLGLGALSAVLSVRAILPTSLVWLSDTLIVTLVFPTVLIAFARMRFSEIHARVSAFLGNISYSVYLLQTPLVMFYSAMPEVLFQKKVATYAPWAGFVFIPAVVASAFIVWKYFEVPAKRSVRRWYATATGTVSEAI